MKSLIISLKILLFFTILTGIIYPLVVTGIVQVLFPVKANGSLISENGTIIGSTLIGQNFYNEAYFMSRPSATEYNPLPSGGSNWGPTNEKLVSLAKKRKTDFITFNFLDSTATVPAEMLFASASGLDPHISPEAAKLQIKRIAQVRHFDERQTEKLNQLVEAQTQNRQYALFGEETVNVLEINIELDKMCRE